MNISWLAAQLVFSGQFRQQNPQACGTGVGKSFGGHPANAIIRVMQGVDQTLSRGNIANRFQSLQGFMLRQEMRVRKCGD